MRRRLAAGLGIALLSASALAGSERPEPSAPLPVAVAPAPNFAGRGSGAALVLALRGALELRGQTVVADEAAASLARGAGLAWSRTLGPSEAAALAKAGGWAGVLLIGQVRRHALHPRLIGVAGRRTELPALAVKGRKVSPAGLSLLAEAIVERLAAPPGEAESFAASAPPRAHQTEAAPPPPPPPPPPANVPTVESTPIRWSLGAGPFAGTRRFALPGGFTYQTAFPYGGPILSGELFPLDSFGPWLGGLGIVADGALGIVQAEFSGATKPFTATDLRADLDLAYRLAPISGEHAPLLQARLGVGLRDFGAPASSGLVTDDRTFGELGLDVTEPLLPNRLALEAGIAYLPGANEGASAQGAFGASHGQGMEWRAGFAGAIWGPFGWTAEVDQERFTDSYAHGIVAEDLFTAYELELTYRPER